MLLFSKEYERFRRVKILRESFNSQIDKILGFLGAVFLMCCKCAPIYAAQGDKIINVIKTITQDFYGDFVYLSIGFATTVCIYHLIMIVFCSSDERARNSHVKAILTAIAAWAIINVFAFLMQYILRLTGQNQLTDIFNTGSYGS